jgi:single-strand DNA-binding protein
MPSIDITVIGNLAGDPELRFTSAGTPVASFTVASNERYQQGGEWKDGPTSWVRCNAWRDLAEHVAESFGKGDRVVLTGTLRQRDYVTKESEKRTVWEVAVTDMGPSIKYATVKISKVHRDGAPVPDDPWADQAPTPEGPTADEPPF